MLLLLCSCPKEELPIITCPYASDLENFHYMGVNMPSVFYKSIRGVWVWEDRDFYCDSTSLIFNNDKTFTFYAQAVCDQWHYPMPFCDLIDDGSDRYKIEISGHFDYTQWFDYGIYPGYPTKARTRFIRGNCNLYVTNSSISSQIGQTMVANIYRGCHYFTLQSPTTYRQYTFKLELPIFTSTDYLTIFIHSSYNISIYP